MVWNSMWNTYVIISFQVRVIPNRNGLNHKNFALSSVVKFCGRCQNDDNLWAATLLYSFSKIVSYNSCDHGVAELGEHVILEDVTDPNIAWIKLEKLFSYVF